MSSKSLAVGPCYGRMFDSGVSVLRAPIWYMACNWCWGPELGSMLPRSSKSP